MIYSFGLFLQSDVFEKSLIVCANFGIANKSKKKKLILNSSLFLFNI